MNIRMLATAAGPMGVYPAGQLVDVADDLASALVSGGYAIATDEQPPEPPKPPSEPKEAPPTRRRRKTSS